MSGALCSEWVLSSILSTLGTLRFTTGFGIVLSTLSRLKGNSLLIVKLAIIFFQVKALVCLDEALLYSRRSASARKHKEVRNSIIHHKLSLQAESSAASEK